MSPSFSAWLARWRGHLRPAAVATRFRHALGAGERGAEKAIRAVGRWRHRRCPTPRLLELTRPPGCSIGPPALRVVLDPRDMLGVAAVQRALAADWPPESATVVVLVRYRRPPVLAGRVDAPVHSWAAPPELLPCLPGPAAPLLARLDAALRLPDVGIRVVQVRRRGARATAVGTPATAALALTWVVPHRGGARWLAECLARLAPQLRPAAPAGGSATGSLPAPAPDAAFVVLDEPVSAPMQAVRAAFPAIWFGALRRPGVGPYVARQRALERATTELLLFQDSDDAPTPDRAARLTAALAAGGLDAVGSHELRLDYLAGAVVARRFPLDASAALRATMGHPVLFPTLLVRRASLLAVGGFSTYLRFGLDTQLLLRAAPTWRIGNVDAFLYLRRRRPGSLTTDPATGIGSAARQHHHTAWLTNYRTVLATGRLAPDSGLSTQRAAEYDGNELEESPDTPL